MILPHYMTKSLGFKAFHNFFVTNLLSFYKQSYSLNGSDLAYHLVGISSHSTSPIPQGTFSTFGLTLSHGWNICFYFADFSARTNSDTVSTCSLLSKPIFKSSTMIGSLKVIDFSHCPFGCFSS